MGLGFPGYTFYPSTFLYDLVLDASVMSVSFMRNQVLLCYKDPDWSPILRNKKPRDIYACVCATLVHPHLIHTHLLILTHALLYTYTRVYICTHHILTYTPTCILIPTDTHPHIHLKQF